MQNKVITFQSTHHVLKAEKILIKAGFKFDIIPTPKNISSDCGMSIRFDSQVSNLSTLSELLNKNDINFKIYDYKI
ncbi:MAG TPA: DUF3343 domain-containing protein [Bacteroidales bacterium]|nr:DUF3343 domain-containing protein [Bacteroidales bacterium]